MCQGTDFPSTCSFPDLFRRESSHIFYEFRKDLVGVEPIHGREGLKLQICMFQIVTYHVGFALLQIRYRTLLKDTCKLMHESRTAHVCPGCQLLYRTHLYDISEYPEPERSIFSQYRMKKGISSSGL